MTSVTWSTESARTLHVRAYLFVSVSIFFMSD